MGSPGFKNDNVLPFGSCSYDGRIAKKNSFHRGQLEVLGINTSGRTTAELSLLHDELPRLESYKEFIDRRSLADLTPERAEKLVFDITQDKEQAEEAYNNIKFAATPLE